MSYILDALRKADAQRERDPARGIHAQPVRVAVGERRPRDGYGVWFRTATAAVLAALASLGWYFYRDGVAKPVAPPVRTEAVVAAPAPAIAAAPAAVPADAVLPPPVVVAPPRVPAPDATPAGAAPVSVVKAKEPSGGAPATATAASAPAAANAAPIAGLPADAPKLAISGGVYSANAAQRMLIVNGQVFNEGGEVGPGLVLEEIRPKAAVLRFRGSRYTVAY